MSQLVTSLVAQIVWLFYIGSKPTKVDTLTDTRIVWNGFGDKQPVPADRAAILLGHPDVWVTEETFKAGVASGLYKPREFVDLNSGDDDIDLEVGMDDDDDENDGESESDSSVIAKIQEFILSIETDKKPKIDTVRAALPDLKITAADLTKAWKELGAPDEGDEA